MSASARIARTRDTVLSRGFKVQNNNSIAATSLVRGIDSCILNYDQIVYKLPTCQALGISCIDQNSPRIESVQHYTQRAPKFEKLSGPHIPKVDHNISFNIPIPTVTYTFERETIHEEPIIIHKLNLRIKPVGVDRHFEEVNKEVPPNLLPIDLNLRIKYNKPDKLQHDPTPSVVEPIIKDSNHNFHIKDQQPSNIEPLPISVKNISNRKTIDGGDHNLKIPSKFDGASPFSDRLKLYDGGEP